MAEFGAPQSRNESILQNMLGANNVLVPPESRIENLLIQILNQGGGGDNVFIATYGTTASGDIAAAINTRKIIIVAKGANVPSEIAVAAQVDGTRVYLHTAKIRTEGTRTAPIFMKTVVDGTTWTTEEIAVATEEQTPFLATINVTTNAQLTAAINAGRPILVKAQGDGQPIYSVLYALKLTNGVVHLITANIVADEEMNNRLRPVFHSYDVDGSTWTTLAPVTALVPRDLANIVMVLPETGVINMRYLLYVPDNSAVGYHYDEYLYVNRNWVYISKDKTFVATIGTTTAATLKDAINAGKIIYVKATGENAPCFLSTMVQVAANNDITLNCTELVHDSQRDIYAPTYTRHSVNGTTNVWTSATVEALPFLATINTTPETALKATIDSKREILVTTAGTNRPYQIAFYAENKGDNGAYLICAKITEDTERWNRLRPTFEAWTIRGTVWTAADPLEAVVEDDLANIMNALPTAGVPKTRYLLKVPDISAEGYHLDEYIYTENKWICISRDNVVRVKPNVTTETELSAAIGAGKMLLIDGTATESMAVVHSYVGTGYVDLYTVEYDTDEAAVSPGFVRHRVVGAAWTETIVGLGAFVATVDSTTELALKGAIGERREILVTTGDNQPYYTVVYAEDKGTDGAHIVVSGIVTDTVRWNRKRSRFTAYTVLGNVWTAADPIDAVLAEDLTNIVTALPTTGVANTRYLLKVTDASTVGYHLDEYIYTENKWVYISKELPAPFIATIKVTSQAEIMAAVNSNSPIYIYSDITGVLWPAISASANAFAATVQYLAVASSSGNYTVDIISCRVVGTTWTSTTISLATKDDLAKKVDALPATGVTGTRYLLKVTDTSTQGYHYDEYVYENSKWINVCQEKITDKGRFYEITDTINVSSIYKENGALYMKSFQLIKLWGWLVQSCCSGTIPGPDNVPSLEVPTSQAVIDYVKGTRLTDSNAFTYNTSQSQGLTISGDYDTNCPRQISKVGRRVNLSFCLKGAAAANGANWTSLGTVPEGYRPTKRTAITAQVYNGNENEPAGGYVDPNGWIVIWTNAKAATNNYQVRINDCWDAE